MVNNGVLTTGYDYPGIDMIVMLRPTQSVSLYVQMIGRGTRPAPGKDNCLVLDFAGNIFRLGPVNDPVKPEKGLEGGRGGQAPVKVCPTCASIIPLSVMTCPVCAYEFPREVKIEHHASRADILVKEKQPEKIPEKDTYEEFPVMAVRYSSKGKLYDSSAPVYLSVSYDIDLTTTYNKAVCLEHGGYAEQKAREWWRTVAETPAPSSVEEALERQKELRTPTHIRVRMPNLSKKKAFAFGLTFIASVLSLLLGPMSLRGDFANSFISSRVKLLISSMVNSTLKSLVLWCTELGKRNIRFSV